MKVSHLKEIRSKCWEVIKTSLFIIIVSGFYACKKNINEDLAQKKVTNDKNTISALKHSISQTKPIAELYSDSRLSKLIEINMSITSKVVNKNKAIMLLNKDKLSDSELNQLAISLGFKNSLEYQNIIFQQSILLKELVNDYNLKNQKKDFINKIILESPIIKDQKKEIMFLRSNCERIRRNCLLEVAATAAGMHFACAALADWTGVGVPICHGAAIIYQLAAGDNCNANAEDCEG